MVSVDSVRVLTGITVDDISDHDLLLLADMHGVTSDNWSNLDVLRVAISAAETMASRATRFLGVTQVEDITVAYDKRATGWEAVAARLRAHLDDLLAEDDGGPFIVEFYQNRPGIEAVHHGFNSF